jgi:hypothetical protein
LELDPPFDAKTAYIASGQPWDSSFIESFNDRHLNEFPDGEISRTLGGAHIIIES